MRSYLKGRLAVLLLAVLGLASIAVLAGGLRELSFRPGRALAEGEAQTTGSSFVHLLQDFSAIPVRRHLAAWIVVFLMVLIVSMLLSPELRRWLIQTFLRFTLMVLALYFLARNNPALLQGLESLGAAPGAPGGAAASADLPPPVFEPPHISPLVILLVSAALALTLAGILWAAGHWWKKRQDSLALRQPIDELASIARNSLDRLSLGSALDDVIMESYMRMSEVVERRRGLARHHAVTTSEFAAYLEAAGFPGEAVRTLTRLFEGVRYGARPSTSDQRDQAISSLRAILDYCGEAA